MKKAAPLTSGHVAQMRNQDRSSLAEFKRIKSLQVKVFFLNEAFRQELITF